MHTTKGGQMTAVTDQLLTTTQKVVADGRSRVVVLAQRLHDDDRGEGVISTAIAVLIIAFIGAAMWVAFNQIWESLRDRTQTQINQIGG